MPVDHVRARDEHLAERYLLQEMSPEETEAFEQHFFECEECASAVEAGDILRANVRAVIAEGWQPAAKPIAAGRALGEWLRKSFGNPAALIPLAASLLLAAVALYQGTVVIPGLRHARILPAFQLISASRGEAAQLTIPKDSASFAIAADIPPDAQYPRYVCELSSNGRTLFQLDAAAPAAGQPITILVPAQDLHAGQFQLVVFGTGSGGDRRDKVSTYSFDVRLQQ